MMVEGGPFKAVGSSASSLHTVGHAWGTTGEHTNLGKKDVLLLEVVKELVEVWTAEVGDGTQSSEQTLARQPLEVALADVLEKKTQNKYIKCEQSIFIIITLLTSIVVRRSNLSKNWVTKMCTSS